MPPNTSIYISMINEILHFTQSSLTLKSIIYVTLIHLLAITELPCKTDGFAGNYDDYQTTPCNTETTTQTDIPAVNPDPETTSKFN